MAASPRQIGVWARCLEQDRMSRLIDMTNAMRFAQNGNKEQFSSFVEELMRMAS
jgi:hypothetical protein